MNKVLLLILDGWGYREQKEGNAIKLANTPNMTSFTNTYPNTTLLASGEAVGLPAGIMGNSEVGHLNIGAGRVVYQTLTAINKSIRTGEFFKNEVLLKAINNAKENNSSLHLLGLASDAGVHSVLPHVYSILKMAKEAGLSKVYLHAFMDGRDTHPTSGLGFIKEIEKNMAEIGVGKVATVGGRYYGMDRDNRWERVKIAYDALVCGKGLKAASAEQAIEEAYKRFVEDKQETDEFIHPTIVDENGLIKDGDSAIFFNFRPDRAVEMTTALNDPDFNGFEREIAPKLCYACMAEYKKTLNLPVAFPPVSMKNILAEVLADKEIPEFRTAETEKFRHVTSFFNGSRLEPYYKEDRILINSPKVATYDLLPVMSAAHVALTAIKEIRSEKYPFIAINFANPDMVGHTGILEAAIEAVEMVDFCAGMVVEFAREKGYTVMITADHGNAEEMFDTINGGPHTAHTTNPVPFILIGDKKDLKLRKDGALSDIAPTVLQIMDVPQPSEMTGQTLIQK